MKQNINKTYIELWQLGVYIDNCRSFYENVDYIIAITRGGAIPGTLLSHQLNKPVIYLPLQTRDDETNMILCKTILQNYPIADKNVVIIDDICDSGVTLDLAIEIVKSCYPARIEETTLVKKKERKGLYSYIQISDPNVWVVFPWETR